MGERGVGGERGGESGRVRDDRETGERCSEGHSRSYQQQDIATLGRVGRQASTCSGVHTAINQSVIEGKKK